VPPPVRGMFGCGCVISGDSILFYTGRACAPDLSLYLRRWRACHLPGCALACLHLRQPLYRLYCDAGHASPYLHHSALSACSPADGCHLSAVAAITAFFSLPPIRLPPLFPAAASLSSWRVLANDAWAASVCWRTACLPSVWRLLPFSNLRLLVAQPALTAHAGRHLTLSKTSADLRLPLLRLPGHRRAPAETALPENATRAQGTRAAVRRTGVTAASKGWEAFSPAAHMGGGDLLTLTLTRGFCRALTRSLLQLLLFACRAGAAGGDARLGGSLYQLLAEHYPSSRGLLMRVSAAVSDSCKAAVLSIAPLWWTSVKACASRGIYFYTAAWAAACLLCLLYTIFPTSLFCLSKCLLLCSASSAYAPLRRAPSRRALDRTRHAPL